MSDRPDVRPEDALDVAQRALAKVNDVERDLSELAETAESLERDLAKANLRLSAYDEDRRYDELSRDDKIGMVREHAFERATDGRGRALHYDDVREAVFDGEPSARHCYDLMRLAADARGFRYQEPANAQIRLVVDPDEARKGVAFCSENNAVVEGGR